MGFTSDVDFERPGYCRSVAVADLALDSVDFRAPLDALDHYLVAVDVKLC